MMHGLANFRQVESTGRHFKAYILSQLYLKTQYLPHIIFTDFFVKNNKKVIYIYSTYYCLIYYYFRILFAAYRMINCFVESTLNALNTFFTLYHFTNMIRPTTCAIIRELHICYRDC
jgi:hypothetical protein